MSQFETDVEAAFARVAGLTSAKCHSGSTGLFSSDPVIGSPLPGFVGRRYRPGGVIFLARNGAIGTSPGDQAQDTRTMQLTKALAKAKATRPAAFTELMDHLRVCLPGWGTYLYVEQFLRATRQELDDVAYLNFVAFRSTDQNIRVGTYAEAWGGYTSHLIAALAPGLIVPLGKPAGVEVERHYKGDATIATWVHRSRGDRYIPEEGLKDVKAAAATWQRLLRSKPQRSALPPRKVDGPAKGRAVVEPSR